MRLISWFILLWAVWIALTWSLAWPELLAGAVVALLIAGFVSRLYPEAVHQVFNPRRWFWIACFIPYFLWYCVKANFDVAYRVLHPDTPIHPGFVKLHTELESELGRVILANSITLTPGTLTVDLEGQDIYIHWINVQGRDRADYHRRVMHKFESILGEIFR